MTHLVVFLMCFALASHASDYKDPLDTPAQMNSAAQNFLLLDIARAGSRLVAVGERGHIIYSDSQGLLWEQANVPASSQLNALYFIDARRGWAAGEDGLILHTEDGGQTWQKQFDARLAINKGPLLDIIFLNADEGFAVGVFSKLYRTVDGGKNWVNWQQHTDNPDEWHFFALAASTDQRIYITSETGLLFRSVDGGNSFLPVQTRHDGSFHGLLIRQGKSGNDEMIAFGVGGKVITSTDSGDSWRDVIAPTDSGLSGATWLPDGSALLVGADGVLVKVSADLKQATKAQHENGLALSSVVTTAKGSAVLVGLGGVQRIPLEAIK